MKILDQEIDFRERSSTLLKEHRIYLLVVLLTQIADSISTTLFMSVDGVESEMNFLVRLASNVFGIAIGPLLGKLPQMLALFGLGVIVPRLFRFLCWAVIGLNTIAVSRNIQHFFANV